jgi:hypothetical protein
MKTRSINNLVQVIIALTSLMMASTAFAAQVFPRCCPCLATKCYQLIAAKMD